jgi:acetoacetyl-CoA synthetase
LRTERPVYGLQARGLDPELDPHERVEDMASSYVETMLSVQRDGPFAVAGFSFGGLVAYEIARVLESRGHAVDWLGLLDPSVHHDCLPPLARRRFLARRALNNLRARLAAGTRLARYSRERVAPWVPLPRDAADVPPNVRRMHDANGRAFAAYRPGPYEGNATFIGSDTQPSGIYVCDPMPVWRRMVRGGLALEHVPGSHDAMVSGPHVPQLAELIDAHLGAG